MKTLQELKSHFASLYRVPLEGINVYSVDVLPHPMYQWWEEDGDTTHFTIDFYPQLEVCTRHYLTRKGGENLVNQLAIFCLTESSYAQDEKRQSDDDTQ